MRTADVRCHDPPRQWTFELVEEVAGASDSTGDALFFVELGPEN